MRNNAAKKSFLGVAPNPVIPLCPLQAPPLLRFPLAPFQMRFLLKEAFLALSTSSIHCSCLCSSFLCFFSQTPKLLCFVFCFFSATVWNGFDLRGRLFESLFFRIFFCFPWSIAISHSSGFRISAHSSRASFRVNSICCSKLCLSSLQSNTIDYPTIIISSSTYHSPISKEQEPRSCFSLFRQFCSKKWIEIRILVEHIT